MHQVTVKRDVLLDRIRDNRDKHRAIFEDALKGYRKAAIEELEKSLDDAKNGKKVRRILALVEPEDHTDDYNLVIDMLENSVDDTITLDARSYAQYMQDAWAWKRQFIESNAAYTAMAME